MVCNKVVIFYEKHDEMEVSGVINALTPLLKDQGIKSYCFEEPSDLSRKANIANLLKLSKFFENCSNIISHKSPCIQAMLSSGMFGEADQNGNVIKFNKNSKLTTLQKKNLVSHANNYFAKALVTKEDYLSLLKKTDQSSLHYCSFDMDNNSRELLEQQDIKDEEKYDIRNEYMRDKVLNQCNEKGDVLVMVGASHFKLANLLKESGVNHVQEYYITSSPIATHYPDYFEGCVRLSDRDHIEYCKDYQFHGLVLDLHANPELNATKIVGQHLVISEVMNDVL